MENNLLQVGAITTTHGLQGEVKVFPMTDDVKRFEELKHVILDTGKEQLKLKITRVKYFKNLVILKFQGYNHINEVEFWKGKPLYITRDQAVKCQEDEYLIADLVGLSVISDEEEVLGVLTEVISTGANDVYVVEMSHGEELLIPAIKDCILKVDLQEKKMSVHLLPGLRDKK